MSRRGDIELAVVAALQPLTRAGGRYLAGCDLYNGELDGAKVADDVKVALLGRAPAVLVTCSTATGDTESLRRNRSRVTLSLELVIVSNHLRSRVAQVMGDSAPEPTADPGALQILEDVEAKLHGRRLGLEGVELVIWGSDAAIVQAPDLTAYRSIYSVRYHTEPQPDALVPSIPIESIEHRHNLDQAGAANPVIVAELPPEVTP